MKKKRLNLNSNEIIILSVVIGVFIALVLGYIFPQKYDIIRGIKVHGKRHDDFSEFNYLLAFCSFVITLGISYIYLIRKSNERNNNNDISESIDNYDDIEFP